MDHRQAGRVPDENSDHLPGGEQHPATRAGRMIAGALGARLRDPDAKGAGLWPRMALRWIDPPRGTPHV